MDEQGTLITNKNRNNNDIYSRIIESKEEVEKLKIVKKENYLSYIHCNGCFKKCALSSPDCGRGMYTREKI